MFEVWLTLRILKASPKYFFNLVSWMALIGMSLGVGALVVVMAVVSGFQTTIEKAVTDVTGHMLVIKRGEPLDRLDILLPRLKKIAPSIVSATPFVHVEAMLAHGGKVSGVVIQGVELSEFEKTLNLSSRLKEGRFDLQFNAKDGLDSVVIGQGLKNKMGVKLGDVINVVLPKNTPDGQGAGFTPQLKKFKVAGVVDLGMYEYDSRFILASSTAAQKLAGIGPFFTGMRVRLSDSQKAHDVSLAISSELGMSYLVRDWMESHHNLLEAIKLEKIVIFFVLLFITIAACFNVSSTLYISVIRRVHDIAALKAMGESPKRLRRFFSLQGVIIGCMGVLGGLILGTVMCYIIANTQLIFVPAEVYHINRLPIDIRLKEVLLVCGVSVFLSYIATLMPAWRAARLDPVEGLRHD